MRNDKRGDRSRTEQAKAETIRRRNQRRAKAFIAGLAFIQPQAMGA